MASSKKSKKKKVLLLIEDNPLLTTLYQSAFEEAGLQVETAHNGEAGLDLARKKKPDAVLLDLLMPGMSGYDVLEKLKKNKETKNIKVIVLTVIKKKESKKKIKKLGAADYLIKTDLKMPQIVAKVISHLG